MAGSMGSFALKRKDFRRTKNPIYSFAVTGKDKDYLCNLNHNNCFDFDSPFGYLIKNHAKNAFYWHGLQRWVYPLSYSRTSGRC